MKTNFCFVAAAASPDNDFTSRQGVVVPFTPFQFQQVVEVFIHDDNILEGDEQFSGSLELPANSAGVILGIDEATATIEDNDRKFKTQEQVISQVCIRSLPRGVVMDVGTHSKGESLGVHHLV